MKGKSRLLAVPIASGVLFGLVTTGFQGFSPGSIIIGLVQGMLLGALMVAISLSSPFQHGAFAGLGYRQQRQVAEAVRSGRAVADPALADVTVLYAQQVRQRRMHDRALAFRLAWGLLVASVIGLVAALVLGSATGLIAAGVSVVVWIVVLTVGPILERHVVANATSAEEATKALLDGNTTTHSNP
jgi:hypothetical protein